MSRRWAQSLATAERTGARHNAGMNLRKDNLDGLAVGMLLACCMFWGLQQVLVNLVGNALDAMADSRDRRLRLATGQGGTAPDGTPLDGWTWVRVEDSGPGVDEAIRARLFEPLVTSRHTGIGLGLALVKRIVERHGGTITYAKGALGGACFTLRLPQAW